jgi:hypothetical protein
MNKLVVFVALAVVSVPALAAGPDMSGLTSAVDAGTIVTAIGAIAAIKILPGVAKWGYSKVIGWFR